MADGIAKLPEDFADLLMELRATRENSIRVHSALGKFGAPLSAHNVSPQHFATEGDAYRFGIAPLKVEVLTKISGVSFDDALNDSQTFDLNGQAVPYIGRAALIRNKQSAGRHKDLADVEELERLAT